ncbi:MAG TPA: flavin reductase family protein [Mycobacteriales bacterium]|nr:flavin reductase family protein [Mycobacteriales bacterium]
MSIHSDHPFATPDAERDPVRRLRGRLASPVTVWTAGGDRDRAGLTVSSTVIAEPSSLFGLLGPDTDLWERLEETGTAVVNVLGWEHRVVADVFAGLHPSPGGMFRTGEWTAARSGPVLTGALAYATVRLREARPAGWSLLVETEIVDVVLPDAAVSSAAVESPLVYFRGRYRRQAPAGGAGG